VRLAAEGKFTGGKVVAKGTAEVGKTLTAKVSGFTPTPSSYKYQWLRDGNKIPGATNATYTLQAADGGHAIKVKVTALRSGKAGKTIKSEAKTVKAASKNPLTDPNATKADIAKYLNCVADGYGWRDNYDCGDARLVFKGGDHNFELWNVKDGSLVLGEDVYFVGSKVSFGQLKSASSDKYSKFIVGPNFDLRLYTIPSNLEKLLPASGLQYWLGEERGVEDTMGDCYYYKVKSACDDLKKMGML